MYKSIQNLTYTTLNETLVDLDLVEKKWSTLNENKTKINGIEIYTISYKMPLMECITKEKNNAARSRNRRGYPMDIIWKSIMSPIIQFDLKNGILKGELGHPSMAGLMTKEDRAIRQLTIDPVLECKIIDKIYKDDNIIMIDCTTVASGCGTILRDRILAGVIPIASARALGGRTDVNGNITDGYTFITADSVNRPGFEIAIGTKDYVFNDKSVVLNEQLDIYGINSNCEISFGDNVMLSYIKNENVSKERINALCDTFGFDYDHMYIENENLVMSRVVNNGQMKETAKLNINKLIDANAHNLD